MGATSTTRAKAGAADENKVDTLQGKQKCEALGEEEHQ